MLDKNGNHICEHCGQVVEGGDCEQVTTLDGTVQDWCHECVEKDAHKCQYCGGYDESLTQVIVGGWSGNYEYEEWCDECVGLYAETCERCGKVVSEDFAREVVQHDGDTQVWCESCTDDHARYCDRCDRSCARRREVVQLCR